MREQAIIDAARIILNDSNKQRWTDARLYQLLDDAQQEICREIPVLVKKLFIQVVHGQEEYSVPNDYVKALSMSYAGELVLPVSMQELDAIKPDWEDDYGTSITHVVVNNMGQRIIRPYPLLSKGAPSGRLKIRYAALPSHLEYNEKTGEVKNALVIPDMWDTGMKQYVVSQAFMDYGDQMSISRAQLAASIYGGIMDKAAKLSRQGSSNKIATTPYQGKVASSRNGYGKA